jgi:hypothetical protein
LLSPREKYWDQRLPHWPAPEFPGEWVHHHGCSTAGTQAGDLFLEFTLGDKLNTFIERQHQVVSLGQLP